MGKPPPWRRDDAKSLLSLVEMQHVDESWKDSFAANVKSRLPLRAHLEKRSEFDFLDELVDKCAVLLSGLGRCDVEEAEALAAHLVLDPAICMAIGGNGGPARVLHAICVDLDGPAMGLLVAVDATVAPAERASGAKMYPSVSAIDVTDALIDTTTAAGELELVNHVVEWTRDYPVPSHASRRRQGNVLFLGDLSGRCIGTLPGDWRDRLRDVSSALGYDSHAVGQGRRFSGSVAADTCVAIEFDPYSGTGPALEDGVPTEKVAPHTYSFEEVLERVCHAIVDASDHEGVDEGVGALPTLGAGARRYHRKVGKSRHFDKFDDGAETPCVHGEASFVPWRGDKCVKGFQRKYEDFEPSMLRHCKKYPNCGVYAVFS